MRMRGTFKLCTCTLVCLAAVHRQTVLLSLLVWESLVSAVQGVASCRPPQCGSLAMLSKCSKWLRLSKLQVCLAWVRQIDCLFLF